MGQYYKPVNIDNKQWVYSHDYNNGLKLMEHSWIGNKFVGAVMTLLAHGGDWFKKPIVWAGDYYDEEGETPYFSLCPDANKLNPVSMKEELQKTAILVNHTKKLYVRYDEMPVCHDGNWVINPLPLLTACGNGRGGGDYHGSNCDEVGTWAGDVLSIEFVVPEDKEYKKFIVEFRE